MAVVSPTPITALPTPPVLSDLATFSTRTDAFINALPTFRNENNALATNVYDNAVDAAASASVAEASEAAAVISQTQAANSASIAATTAAATLWVAGNTNAVGVSKFSPSTFLTYRDTTGGLSNIDPALDSPRWICMHITTPHLALIPLGII